MTHNKLFDCLFVKGLSFTTGASWEFVSASNYVSGVSPENGTVCGPWTYVDNIILISYVPYNFVYLFKSALIKRRASVLFYFKIAKQVLVLVKN